MIDTGFNADPNKGPPSTNQTLCQSPSVNTTGTELTCTTASHAAGSANLLYFNNLPSTAVNSFSSSDAYTYIGESTPPTQPGIPVSDDPITVVRPTWIWAESSDDSGIDHYLFEWCTNINFTGCGAGSGNVNTSAAIYTHVSDLPNGTWYARVTAFDVNNNQSTLSETGAHIINTSSGDSTEPTIPGTPSTTSPTTDTTPSWTWTASSDDQAVSHYIICWDTVSDGCTNSAAVSSNSFTHTVTLATNIWYAKVRAVDTSGNTSAFSPVGNVQITSGGDITPPTTPDLPTTTNPTNNTTPTWMWLASTDNVGVDHYEACWGITSGSCGSSHNNIAPNTPNVTFTTTGLDEGTWYFNVRAVDAAGNASAYSSIGSVVIDTTSPSIPGNPIMSTPTIDTTPNSSWPSSSDGSGTGLLNYIVQWSKDSNFVSGVLTDSSNSNSCTLSSSNCGAAGDLSDGIWYVRVQATDVVGNTSAFSSVSSVLVDTVAPNDPASVGSTSHALATWKNDSTIDVSWPVAGDNGTDSSGVDGYSISWSENAAQLPDTTKDIDVLVTSSTSPTLSDGVWYFNLRTVDKAGNWTSTIDHGPFYIDTTSPVQPGQPVSLDPVTDDTPSWSWMASSDSHSGVSSYEFEWCDNVSFSGCGVGSGSATTSSTSYTHTVPLSNDEWYSRVRAIDGAGLASSFSPVGSKTINTSSSASQNPTAPGKPATITPTKNTKPTWVWTASSDNVAVDYYIVCWDMISDGCTNSTTVSSNNFTHATFLSDGSWSFKVRAVGTSGNQSPFSDVGNVVVDTTGPSAPGKPIADAKQDNKSPEFYWTPSTDGGSGVSHYIVEWSMDQRFATGVISDTTTSLKCVIGASRCGDGELATGSWYIRVRAVDNLGNVSAYSLIGSVAIQSTKTLPNNASSIFFLGSYSGGSSNITASAQAHKSNPPTSQIQAPLKIPQIPAAQSKPLNATNFNWLWLLVLLFAILFFTSWWLRRPRIQLIEDKTVLRVALINMGPEFVSRLGFHVSPNNTLVAYWKQQIEALHTKKDAIVWHMRSVYPFISGRRTGYKKKIIEQNENSAGQIQSTEHKPLAHSYSTKRSNGGDGFDYIFSKNDATKLTNGSKPSTVMTLRTSEPEITNKGSVRFEVRVTVARTDSSHSKITWQLVDNRSLVRKLLGLKPSDGTKGWTLRGSVEK